MWLLKKYTDGTTKYLISEKQSYIVGRKNCDIIIENDPSVSRKHCTIYIAKQNECPFTVNTFTGVWIVDEQSKYGTYLKINNEWVKISPNENRKLSSGTFIKFGLMENVWSIEFRPLRVCTSGIPNEQKKKFENAIKLIDGFLSNTWSQHCSLIIVKEITLTVKVVLALIHGIPIVTPNYLQRVIECIKNQLVVPNYADYRPEIKEILLDKSLVSLNFNKDRQALFKGLKFLIPTKKQFETLKEVIISAGGETELLSCNGDWKRFAKDDVIVIQLPFNNSGIPDEFVKSFNEITCFLKNNYRRRVIPESEIAQAVAYASTDKFCNPANTWVNIQISEKKDVNLGSVIVEETPVATEEARHSSVDVVPCSATIDSELPSHEPVDLQSSELKNLESQANVLEKQMPERKRTHSTNKDDHELEKKKARSDKISNDEGRLTPQNASSAENEILQNNRKRNEIKPNNSKKNQTTTRITNFFHKQSKPLEENTPKMMRQSSSDFWNCDVINNFQLKRKVSCESDDSNENPSKKKPKLPTTPEIGIDTPREIVQVVERNNSCEKSVPFPPIKKSRNIIKENNFNDFFGKEKTDAVDDLNITIFSLKLISPAYLKEDGSLIEPPSEPVNVKRFKKQKLFSSLNLRSLEENEDEILNGEWIEPHSNRLNISVGN